MSSLRAQAMEISPEAVQVVEKKAPWDETLKLTLIESSSQLGAKYANKVGISAEYAPEVTFAIAAGALLEAHMSLSSDLQRIAAELKAERDKAAKEAHKKALTHAPA